MAMHPTVEKHLDEIRELAASYGVEKLEIFGSAMTPEFDPERSDVDFIVHYPPGYDYGYFAERFFDLEEAIADVLNRPAQLVMTDALQKERFRRNAELTRIVIYAASESDRSARRHSEALPTHH